MRIASPIVLMVCAILALVGMSLPWYSLWIFGDLSGWDWLWEWEATLVLIGSILLLACSIPALVLGAMRKAWGVVLGMGITSVIAAVMAIAGPVYIVIDAATDPLADISMVGAGVYVCIVAGFIAFIFGILTATVRY